MCYICYNTESDEKRIGLRQSLLETINSQLSKENDTGKHKLLNHHQNLGLCGLDATQDSLHAFSSKMATNGNNNGNVNGPGSSQSNSSSNYTQVGLVLNFVVVKKLLSKRPKAFYLVFFLLEYGHKIKSFLKRRQK